jgi:asparagine synthase (glutamine-hydrolysing)
VEAHAEQEAELDVAVCVDAERGWRVLRAPGLEFWSKAYGLTHRLPVDLVERARGTTAPSRADCERFLPPHDGHYALILNTPGWSLLATDPARSIPLAFAEHHGRWLVDDRPLRLARAVDANAVNADAALSVAMAGYTIDDAVLLDGVSVLGPGECALLSPGQPPTRWRYHRFEPWRAVMETADPQTLRVRLAELLLGIIDEMMRGIGDRVLAVPLSAGRDSRLIVSAARHLGYRNVRTFAYGQPGNHEARASQAIAERLGFPWQFVPVDHARMRDHYRSSVWSAYQDYADTLQATPFVQDLPQVIGLLEQGYLPEDAVMCNGNSGDFISGGHIPQAVRVSAAAPLEESCPVSARALYDRHFQLWQSLRTEDHRERLEALLLRALRRTCAGIEEPVWAHGLYESAEFRDRQTKYVVGGQRAYDFLRLEWRLPLWQQSLMDFFARLPLDLKVQQRLYADTLTHFNWGGVWRDVAVNRKVISPGWIRPVRWLAKAAHAPLGRRSWHGFERRFLNYWMEPGSQSGLHDYLHIARDRRGARHAVSWLTEVYLNKHGLAYDGAPFGSPGEGS